MKRPYLVFAIVSLFVIGTTLAEAHAFLDHADPKVGSTVNSTPYTVKIWFTEDIHSASSKIEVFDATGKEVDKRDVKIDSNDKSLMSVTVSTLPPGPYKVVWNAVCPLGHHTSGSFSFDVKGP